MYNHGVWIGFQIAPENTSIDLIKDCASDIVALFLVSFRTAGDIDIHVCFFVNFGLQYQNVALPKMIIQRV